MIKYVKGDIFNSPSKIIVNTVNIVGVMGKGVALEFKKRYPEMFDRYQELCKKQLLDVGKLYLWRGSEKWVLLFPTKKHWRYPSKIEYIEKGLQKFVENWDKLGSNTISFPRLGCGNGGLDWQDVKPLMEKYLSKIPMQILVYVDNYNDPLPEHKDVSEMEKWLSGELGLSGYEAFKVKLDNLLESENEIQLGNKKHKIENVKGMISIDDVLLEESQVCDLWNWVRDAGVIMPEEMPYEYHDIAEVFLELMRKLECVVNVFVSKDGFDFTKTPNAFQYVAD